MIIEGKNTSNLTFNVIQLHFKSKVKIYTLVYNKFPNVCLFSLITNHGHHSPLANQYFA